MLYKETYKQKNFPSSQCCQQTKILLKFHEMIANFSGECVASFDWNLKSYFTSIFNASI